MEVRQIEFGKLKYAYILIKQFIESEGGTNINSLKNKVNDDLIITGNDNYELLEKFVTKFELDHGGFDYNKHFHSEGELYDSEAALINLLTLSVWLPLKTIELLTLNKVKIEKPDFYKPSREVKDLTFKDSLTWYIEKEFKLSSQIKYEIKIDSSEL